MPTTTGSAPAAPVPRVPAGSVSHLHLPDGVLPLWLIACGWLAAALLMALALRAVRRSDRVQLVPRVGVMAALVLAVMSTEIVPIAYHLNLTVLAGIVLGPAAGALAAAAVVFILALFGHGGVTVIGINTVIIACEIGLGSLSYRFLLRVFKHRPGLAAGFATVVTLAVSTTMMIGVVGLSGLSPSHARDLGSLDPATLSLSNPFAGGLVANRIITPESGDSSSAEGLSLKRFAIAVYVLGSIGWVIEGVLTGMIVSFIHRLRADLLDPASEVGQWT